MKKVKQKINDQIALKSVWLVYWDTQARGDEKEYLKNFNIYKKYINLISSRQSFDNIFNYAKDLYQLLMTSYYIKATFASYNKGARNKRDYFETSIPLYTSFTSGLYTKLNNALNHYGANSQEYKLLSKQWQKHPEWVSVGHSPALNIIKVYDFVYYEDYDGNEIMEWTQRLNDLSEKKMKSINGW
jgi:hypothetical protein